MFLWAHENVTDLEMALENGSLTSTPGCCIKPLKTGRRDGENARKKGRSGRGPQKAPTTAELDLRVESINNLPHFVSGELTKDELELAPLSAPLLTRFCFIALVFLAQ